MKRSNLCALIVALLFFAGSSFIYNAATKDTNSTIQLALIDGSIASNIKYDRKKIWHNKDEIANNIDDDLNGFTDDIIGWNFRENNNVLFSPKAGEHGTSLMFLLNGKSKGYSSLLEGVNCSIMPVRILSENDGARLSDLIEAIKYAERMGADICNLSIATSRENEKLYEVMKKSKMLFIVAAGNDGELIDDSNVVYPAMYDLENMITVGSARQNGNIADFSNYSNEFVDVLAPGERILSQNQDNEWEYYDGTTYSTAYVSAMAIRTMINEGIETAKDIKTSVIKKANDRNKLKKYVKYGSLINKSENR